MTRHNAERSKITTRQLGQSGEALAAQYLVQRGYTLVTQNWRCEAGEVDLIMRQDETWVFIEVKSITGPTPEQAALKVNRAKQKRLVRCLYLYLDMHQLDVATRVDVIAIAFPPSKPPIIEHREDILEFNLFDEA